MIANDISSSISRPNVLLPKPIRLTRMSVRPMGRSASQPHFDLTLRAKMASERDSGSVTVVQYKWKGVAVLQYDHARSPIRSFLI
jgi:hypothetical protein